MPEIVLIIHNIRSCLNVGAMLRTAEGLGISEVILTGYTPYPKLERDDRLPHIAEKIDKQIAKSSLGAENMVKWTRSADLVNIIERLRNQSYQIAALEQAKSSVKLNAFIPPSELAIIVGNEVTGLEPEILELCDMALEIPMAGRKESFNVASATAMALYHCRFR